MRKLIFILLFIIISLNVVVLFKVYNKKDIVIKEQKEVKEIEKKDTKIYDKYTIGNEILINQETWYAIADSDEDKDYVTAININYNRKIKDCFNKYIHLNEKKYFEGEYSKSIGIDKLKEVDGYYIRLIKLEEYEKLATITKKDIDQIKYNYTTKPNYTWIKDINTLSMTDIDFYDDVEDKTNLCSSWYIQSNIRQIFSQKDDFINIQPVINIYKEKI